MTRTNTDVPGSPASCRATAEALEGVAAELAVARGRAADGAATPEEQFAGATADAYRRACTTVARSAASAHDDAARSAAALATYGEQLADVQGVMERVRASAAGHGLLDGTDLVLPPAPTPRQRRAHDRLAAIVADARAHLARAGDRLAAALPGRFPADPADSLLPPVEVPPGPFLFPPPPSAWPPDPAPDHHQPEGGKGSSGRRLPPDLLGPVDRAAPEQGPGTPVEPRVEPHTEHRTEPRADPGSGSCPPEPHDDGPLRPAPRFHAVDQVPDPPELPDRGCPSPDTWPPGVLRPVPAPVPEPAS